MNDLDLQSHGAGSPFRVFQDAVHSGRIDEQDNAGGWGYQFAQKSQALCRQLTAEEIDAGRVAAGTSEARNQTEPDRVFGDGEDDGLRLLPWPPMLRG